MAYLARALIQGPFFMPKSGDQFASALDSSGLGIRYSPHEKVLNLIKDRAGRGAPGMRRP